jgi:hypothetical protein
MVATYGQSAEDVSHMAALGGHGNDPSHCQRDLLNMKVLNNICIPEPSPVEAWVLKQRGGITVMEKETIYYFKPSAWYNALEKQGLLHDVFGVNDIETWVCLGMFLFVRLPLCHETQTCGLFLLVQGPSITVRRASGTTSGLMIQNW